MGGVRCLNSALRVCSTCSTLKWSMVGLVKHYSAPLHSPSLKGVVVEQVCRVSNNEVEQNTIHIV